MARNFSIFVSHSWDYVDDLRNLRNLLYKRDYFHVEFNEVPPDDPIESTNSTYIKAILKRQILDSNIMLALSGVYATYSDWMRWEIATAKSAGIPIVGVIPRGQMNTSTVVSSNAETQVGWNTESIVLAIRRYALK